MITHVSWFFNHFFRKKNSKFPPPHGLHDVWKLVIEVMSVPDRWFPSQRSLDTWFVCFGDGRVSTPSGVDLVGTR